MVVAFDYTTIFSDLDEALQEFGRSVTFVRTSAAAADSTRPWRDDKQSEEARLPNVMAIVSPYESKDDKDAVRYEVKMVIVSGDSFPNKDGVLFDRMIDSDGSVYHLHDAAPINPGGVIVAYTFRAEQ